MKEVAVVMARLYIFVDTHAHVLLVPALPRDSVSRRHQQISTLPLDQDMNQTKPVFLTVSPVHGVR